MKFLDKSVISCILWATRFIHKSFGIMLTSKHVIFFLIGIFSMLSLGTEESPKKHPLNLNSDPRYYQFVSYPSVNRSNETLQLVLVDNRPNTEKAFNEEIQWFDDDIWTEPPSRMMQNLFSKELRSSNIFKKVDAFGMRQSLILGIELISLIGHYNEKTRITTGRVKVHSTLKTASNKHIILDKDYENASSYQVHRYGSGYKHMYDHIGKATHAVVEELMTDLE